MKTPPNWMNGEPNSRIGFDREADSHKYFVTASGIVVLAQGVYTPESSRHQ